MNSAKVQSADLSEMLLNFVKNPKNIFKSRSTTDTVLISLEKPPTDVFLSLI